MTHTTPDRNEQSRAPDRTLYRTLWRWHFYAGLFCIPFVLVLSITGAIYLFKPQIDRWNERDYQSLTLAGERAAPNVHIDSALAALPHARFLNYRVPESTEQAVAIGAESHGENWRVYVHPHTGEVLNAVLLDEQFIAWVKKLHGELLIGPAGSILVELAACWAIILLITGLYLWWPRSGRGFAGVLYPRLTGNGRLFWRDLHAVTGIWVAAFTLFLLITALPWTEVWGSLFKELRQPQVNQSWDQNSAEQRHHWEQQAAARADLSPQLLAKARAQTLTPPVELTLDDAEQNLWKLSSKTQNRPLRRDLWLDGDSAEILRRQSFADKGALDRAVGFGIAAHEGQLFGWFNQLLGLLTAMGLVTLALSGFILWRRRKPDTALGAPSLPSNSRVARTVTGVVLVCALLLPLVAASLLALIAIEWLLLKRIKPVALWLGLRAPTR